MSRIQYKHKNVLWIQPLNEFNEYISGLAFDHDFIKQDVKETDGW